MNIYDCFCFFNELDILELRLNILDPYVDYFVLSEASVTHTGTSKPYYFEENNERFKKFLHKIIHLKITDTPDDFVKLNIINNPKTFDEIELNKIYTFIHTQTKRFDIYTQQDYGRDFFQKECIRRGLYNCSDDDIIIFSDADEIPNPSILKNIIDLDLNKFYTFKQNFYTYYINVSNEAESPWFGSKMGTYKNLKDFSYNELRAAENMPLENGGWHFSFMGGRDQVIKKLTSYSASDMVNSNVLDAVDYNINNDIDPFFRSRLKPVTLDESFPEYILKNKEKYRHLIKELTQ
tara:strand:- start:15 stop:893 length:879 start_codon:yes stop_codon:yes gene_type:complete